VRRAADALQLLRPYLTWVWVQSERPFLPPAAVCDIPGVRYSEPDPGHAIWRCEVPHTAWMLEPVRAWFHAIAGQQPPRHATSYAQVPLQRELYAHQREAVEAILAEGSLLLGDQMGLGKTTSALVAAARLRQQTADRPVLIVAPKALRGVWRSEVAAVFGEGAEHRFAALEGVDPTDADATFWLVRARWIFCHYDIVHAWWSQIVQQRPCAVIADEVHLAKNSRTKRGKALALAASVAVHRILLTGTPVPNRVGELWNLLQLVTGKWTWGGPRAFRTRYAGAYFDGHGLRDTTPTHTDELRARMRSCYLRRTVDDAGLELPPLTRQVVDVALRPGAWKRYRALLDGHNVRAVMAALRNRAASRRALEWLGKLRKITSKAKLAHTVVHAQAALDEGEPVVVFTWQRETAERIASKLGAAPIHGGVPQAERERIIAYFQAQPQGAEPWGIVATLDSMSVGVTLHRARILIMHDLDWVPANMLQAEAREYRIGQQRPVLSKWMVAEDTLDELFVRAVRAKAPAMAAAGDFSAETLADVLGEDEVERGVENLLRWAEEG